MSDEQRASITITTRGRSGMWFVVWTDRTGAMRAVGPVGDWEASDLAEALRVNAVENGRARGYFTEVEQL